MSTTFIGEHMVKFPRTASSTLTVREAFYLMEEWKVRHLPVVEDGKLVGLVSERDLRQFFNTKADLPVGEVMTEAPYCVRVGTSLEEVLAAMDKKKIGSAVVASASGEVLGIFTTTDAVRLLRRLLREGGHAEYSRLGIEDVFENLDTDSMFV